MKTKGKNRQKRLAIIATSWSQKGKPCLSKNNYRVPSIKNTGKSL
jgi:hypothetical protein